MWAGRVHMGRSSVRAERTNLFARNSTSPHGKMIIRKSHRLLRPLVWSSFCSSRSASILGAPKATIQVPAPLSPEAREPATHFQMASEPRDESLANPDYFELRKLFTVRDLYNARVHLGHATGTLDDRMRQFIFGKRFNHLIFDLDQTAENLRVALNIVAHIAYRGGIIVFVCRNPIFGPVVEQTAIEVGEYSHTRHWRLGTLVNANHLHGSVTRLPDLLIFLSTLDTIMQQHEGVSEAAKVNIPTVGIVDSNCDPNLITYPVPGNDDSLASALFYCKVFKEAVLAGKKKRAERSLGNSATV